MDSKRDEKKISFNEAAVTLNSDHDGVENGGVTVKIYEERDKWGNQIEFILAIIGFAVGLGNVWRFPYLCQKNGGGAFLIPYFICLLLLGIPLFFLELGIGQSLRRGSLGVWNAISPYLGGVGIASVIVSFLVGLYYNMIIAWCFYYLFASWQNPLPYSSCPENTNATRLEYLECKHAGETQFYWYRKALHTSSEIEESGGMVWHLPLCLLLAWTVVFLCMMKGVQSAGKAVYFTATFPYIVLTIFFVRGITLEGSYDGIKHMFKPQFEKLSSPQVWMEAATQIFLSLSLAFGGLIAMSSYNPIHNNCRRDAIMVSIINCSTSVFASIVIFSILGFKATLNFNSCLERNEVRNMTIPGVNGSVAVGNQTLEDCKTLEFWLSEVASGPGLTFIAFTEAIDMLPISQLWATLFFCMLLTLGLGSMFGTLEGVVTPIYDLKLVPWRKEIITGLICLFCYFVGLLFCQRSGEYWLQMFDTFAANMPLLLIAFFECIGVSYVYGSDKFDDDIEYMISLRPGFYWRWTWRYISPLMVAVIIIASVINMVVNPVGYTAWNAEKGETELAKYPSWGYIIIAFLMMISMLMIPGVFVLRYCGILKYEQRPVKAGQELIVPPGTVTPSLSHVPLTATAEPLDGEFKDEDEDIVDEERVTVIH